MSIEDSPLNPDCLGFYFEKSAHRVRLPCSKTMARELIGHLTEVEGVFKDMTNPLQQACREAFR